MKTTPSRAMTEPTDSSMPPVMMTKPSPIENRPNRPTRLAVLARLIGEQEARIDERDDGADDEDQDEQAEIFLQHQVRLCLTTAVRRRRAAARSPR